MLRLLVLAVIAAGEDLVESTVREMQDEMEETEVEERRIPRTKASVHPLTDIPEPGGWETASAHLISHAGLEWTVGDEVTVLCHFSHRLKKSVNVTALMGSLNSPVNFGYYLQNFTLDNETYVAEAHEDVTFDYTFRLADTLDAGTWQVALTLYYSVGRYLFATTFFNETVTLKQPPSGLSFLWVLLGILATVAAGYFGRDHLVKNQSADNAAAAAKARAEAIAAAQDAAKNDESWTAHLDSSNKKSKPSKKSSKSKKK